ncbi:MAG: tRNA lysidine(34) synthetase TilS [Gammaproteobacteria bacterium]|nr:tRNA lysidine(34) synthetase TilS [Gammaproteobacteria bacterium]
MSDRHQIQQQIGAFFKRYPVNGRLIVAYSGGCDSTVLLHVLASHYPSGKILAVHINHNLQADSDMWEQFCQSAVTNLEVEYQSISLSLGALNSNIEEQARIQRYQSLSLLMSKGDALLTAHHQDDQAETFMLQLLRGAGLKGLSAMAEVSNFPPGKLFRPLLNFSREQIEDYAKLHDLKWIDDPSNADDRFDRNFLRHQVMPLLESRWSAAKQTIARSAENCREAAMMIDDISVNDLFDSIGAYKHSLSISKLREFPEARRHALVRAWVEENDFPLPDRNTTRTICSDFINLRQDAQPLLNWSYVQLYRFDDYLYLIGSSLLDQIDSVKPSVNSLRRGKIELPYPCGKLRVELLPGVSDERLADAEVCFRQQGQTVNLKNRRGSRKLKKLLQEWHVPPWMRNFVPIIHVNGQCQTIADYARCDTSSAVFEKTQWQPPAELDWRNNLKS